MTIYWRQKESFHPSWVALKQRPVQGSRRNDAPGEVGSLRLPCTSLLPGRTRLGKLPVSLELFS